MTEGVIVIQLAHMNGNSPTIIQASAETGESDDENSDGIDQTMSANDAGSFPSRSAFKACSHWDPIERPTDAWAMDTFIAWRMKFAAAVKGL